MTGDHGPFTHSLEAWLDTEDDFLDADAVLERALEQVETKPQRRADSWSDWRSAVMNKTAMYVAAAAAVAVIALVGFGVLGGFGAGGFGGPPPSTEPSVQAPTPTPEPSVAEPTSSADASVPEGPGPFSFAADGSFSPNDSGMTFTVTIPDSGWTFDDSWNLLGPGDATLAPFIVFWAFPDEEFYVPADPCRGTSTMPDTPAATVDEIAAALAAQASRDASEPIDVMIDGYAGKSLTLHAPAGVDESGCETGTVITYTTSTNPDLDPDGFWRNTQRPDEVSDLWILDVGGAIVIIDAVSSPDDPAELVEEVHGVVESTTFELP